MVEHLLNIRETAEYLGLSEKRIKELVDQGKIPAYRIGGAFLRFKKTQLDIIRATLREIAKNSHDGIVVPEPGRFDDIKDFLYYNDFYILSVVVIIIAVVLMLAT